MKLAPILCLSLLAAISMTSCVVPGDLSYGPGYSSASVGYRQYNTLPSGYVGNAYLYGGRYYSGGRYENGSFYNQGRSYNDRYYHNGQYYYGGSHQHYGTQHTSSHRSNQPYSRIQTHTVPTSYSSHRTAVRSPFLYRR